MTGHHVRVLHPDAPDGKALKYSHPERERRFLMRAIPEGEVVRIAAIEDLYIAGTRLRLRKLSYDGDTCYKFTQKIPRPEGGPGLITTLYLSEAEYRLLSSLPGDRLGKTRYSIPPMGFDAFEGPLAGLFMGEMEFTSDEEMAAFAPPPGTVAEVTLDERFTGGVLVHTRAEELATLLRSMGVSD
jgi:CYTH domain-containing protein